MKRGMRGWLLYNRKSINLPNEKKVHVLENQIILLFALTVMVIFVVLFVLFNEYPFQSSHKIIFKDLNSSQVQTINNILKEVKPMYLNSQKEIKFVNSIDDECGDCSQIKNGFKLVGFNQHRNIVVEWKNDEAYLKTILCHELLHSYVYGLKEDIVYDLADYSPCYELSNT